MQRINQNAFNWNPRLSKALQYEKITYAKLKMQSENKIILWYKVWDR